MYSMTQLRNVFYACIHQSTTKHLLEDNMSKTSLLIKDTQALVEVDKHLEYKMRDMNTQLVHDINENKDEFTLTTRTIEKNMGAMKAKLTDHGD